MLVGPEDQERVLGTGNLKRSRSSWKKNLMGRDSENNSVSRYDAANPALGYAGPDRSMACRFAIACQAASPLLSSRSMGDATLYVSEWIDDGIGGGPSHHRPSVPGDGGQLFRPHHPGARHPKRRRQADRHARRHEVEPIISDQMTSTACSGDHQDRSVRAGAAWEL